MLRKSEIRRLVIREFYNTKLSQLYEQAPPDPTAAPAAAPPTDPTAAAPPADPTAAGAPPVPGAPPAGAPPAPGAPPMPGAPPDPLAAGGAPAAPGAPPAPAPGAAPGVGAAGTAAKAKSATPPDPEKEPMKAQLNKALMKATKTDDSLAVESLRRKSMRFLLEADDKPKIDIGVYAGEVARLIKNYTSLVDIKKNVIAQAEQYLDDEFGDGAQDLKTELTRLLRTQYQISLERPEPPEESYAVGAGGGSGAGGGA